MDRELVVPRPPVVRQEPLRFDRAQEPDRLAHERQDDQRADENGHEPGSEEEPPDRGLLATRSRATLEIRRPQRYRWCRHPTHSFEPGREEPPCPRASTAVLMSAPLA